METYTVDEDREPLQNVRKISVSLSNEVLEWVYKNKGDLKVSTFINKIIRDRIESSNNSSCNICEDIRALDRRMSALEEDIKNIKTARPRRSLSTGVEQHVSVPSPGYRDVYGELISIKNVSAENARAVYEELMPFIREKGIIDRPTVLKELFPHTKSRITNNINYWYNACRSILDHMVQQGMVVKLEKNRYKWVGERGD